MLDLKLPWKKVAFKQPIDFEQWQLDRQVRGLHMTVDQDGDMIAVPVVLVDPTRPMVVASNPGPWEDDVVGLTVANVPASTNGALLFTAAPGYEYEMDWLSVQGDLVQPGDRFGLAVICNAYTPLVPLNITLIPTQAMPVSVNNPNTNTMTWVGDPPLRLRVDPDPSLAGVYVGLYYATDATVALRDLYATACGRRRKI